MDNQIQKPNENLKGFSKDAQLLDAFILKLEEIEKLIISLKKNDTTKDFDWVNLNPEFNKIHELIKSSKAKELEIITNSYNKLTEKIEEFSNKPPIHTNQFNSINDKLLRLLSEINQLKDNQNNSPSLLDKVADGFYNNIYVLIILFLVVIQMFFIQRKQAELGNDIIQLDYRNQSESTNKSNFQNHKNSN